MQESLGIRDTAHPIQSTPPIQIQRLFYLRHSHGVSLHFSSVFRRVYVKKKKISL